MAKVSEIVEERIHSDFDPIDKDLKLERVDSLNDLRLGDMVEEGVYVAQLVFKTPDKPNDPIEVTRAVLWTISVIEDEGRMHILPLNEVKLALAFPMKVARGSFPPKQGVVQFPKGYGQEEVSNDCNG